MATAMPSRRVNQCEMSASSGAKVPELPTPISRLATANVMRLGAKAEAMKESPSRSAEPASGRTMPKRSTSRPIATAPMPKPIIASV